MKNVRFTKYMIWVFLNKYRNIFQSIINHCKMQICFERSATHANRMPLNIWRTASFSSLNYVWGFSLFRTLFFAVDNCTQQTRQIYFAIAFQQRPSQFAWINKTTLSATTTNRTLFGNEISAQTFFFNFASEVRETIQKLRNEKDLFVKQRDDHIFVILKNIGLLFGNWWIC